ncbi:MULTISPECIES: tetratricopeptide repeat protein [unclassified Nitrospina]|uniref:tetratricopeptide repeat protein n=1 Tax=unclassified Nitrospina TaxID=2638683 RepID=UPI003F9C84A7
MDKKRNAMIGMLMWLWLGGNSVTGAWAFSPVDGYLLGYKAYLRHDFNSAFQHWMPLAWSGNADAQYQLGILYLNGQGVPLDTKKAAKWFLASALQGDVGAQYFLAELYRKGLGVDRDLEIAAAWYRKAAEQDYPDAQYRLGTWYADVTHDAADPVQAYVWLALAARNGIQPVGVDVLGLLFNLSEDELLLAKQSVQDWVNRFESRY